MEEKDTQLVNSSEMIVPVEPEQSDAQEQRKPPRRWLWVVAVVGVLLFAAAAFLGGRLLSGQPLSPFEALPMMRLGGGKGGVSMRTGVKLNMELAAEIPTREADVHGMIAELKDKALMIGTNPQVVGAAKEGQEPQITWTSNDPLVEVVITQETKIYQDTTFENRTTEGDMPAENEKIQQTVKEISLKDLEKDNFVQVWGYRRGDRMVAEVLLYNQPVMIRKKN